MKRLILKMLFVLLEFVPLWAQTPRWVTNHPVSEQEYIGIGMAPLSDADYMKKATQNALADIASQISIKLENNSFLHTVDVDGKARDMFEGKIQSSMVAWMEGQELKETYQSNDNYYVYYSLDKKVYARNSESRRKQVVQIGLDYLQKGREAESMMNLAQAVQLYGKGLEAVEPWVFMDLMNDGVNIPTELYHAFVNVFSNMTITTNVVQVEGEAFKAISIPLAGCLSKNGDVVPNVKLKAYFVTGGGAVSEPIETDHTGTAEFYVTNITSKEGVQDLRISIDDSFMQALPDSYRQLLQNQVWPSAKVTVLLKSVPVTAYLYINDENDLEGIEKRISSLLTNNHFTMSEDSDASQIFIDLTTKMELGSVVKGGMYDLNTCYCTFILKFYNNKTEQLLLDYSVNQVKVLSPVHKSAEETIAMCIREVMKRVNRELPNRLKKLSLKK